MAFRTFTNAVKTLTQGVKMMEAGSSEQEARSFVESQGLRNVSITRSTPMAVDVSAEGMKKKSKTLARGTGVTYSGVRTSSQGLLTGARTEKKTLLGG
jgi:hypothetical protein